MDLVEKPVQELVRVMVIVVVKEGIQLLYFVHQLLRVQTPKVLFALSHLLEELLQVVYQVVFRFVQRSEGENHLSESLTMEKNLYC